MSDVPTGGRPVFTGPIVPLAVRVPEELATYLELLANINGRSKTDEYRVALENHAINAKSDPRVQTRVQQVIERIEAEAKAKRDVLSSMLASKSAPKATAPKTPPTSDKAAAPATKAPAPGIRPGK